MVSYCDDITCWQLCNCLLHSVTKSYVHVTFINNEYGARDLTQWLLSSETVAKSPLNFVIVTNGQTHFPIRFNLANCTNRESDIKKWLSELQEDNNGIFGICGLCGTSISNLPVGIVIAYVNIYVYHHRPEKSY